MKHAERALRTLRSLVQFEMAQAVGHISAAVRSAEEASRHVRAFESRQAAVVRGIRQAQHRPVFNPALRASLRREYDFAGQAAKSWMTRLLAARRREAEGRSELARLRHRDRGLTRSIMEEQKVQAATRQRAEYLVADESWLQQGGGMR